MSGTSASASTSPTKSWEKVYFAAGSTTLTKAAKTELRQIAREYAGASTIVVTGYVQKGGSTWNNYTLAKKRAKAVTKYLKARGMTAKLTTKSGGVPKTGGTSTKARRATLAITMPAAVVEPPKDDDAPLCPTDNSTAMKLTVVTTDGSRVVNLPLFGINDLAGGIEVNWGDGTALDNYTSVNQGATTHTYASTGTFEITITGSMTTFGYNDEITWTGVDLLTSVGSFGTLGITALPTAFLFATNLVSVPNTLPPNVTNLWGTFAVATAFNQDISCWDTSAVTNMSYMFVEATAFNQPLGDWDTSNVTNMYAMFGGATAWSSANVDDTLIGWALIAQQEGVTLDATSCRTDASTDAVTTLTSAPNNWTVNIAPCEVT